MEDVLTQRSSGKGWPAWRFGIQAKLGISVLVSLLVSAILIVVSLEFFGQTETYRNNLAESEAMVQAASLAFSRALARHDDVLLDALLHELQSRQVLHIRQAYVLDTTGRVAAHTISSEYGKHYPLPALLKEPKPKRLTQVLASGAPTFHVVSLLRAAGTTQGALVVTFGTEHLAARLRAEMAWILAAVLPLLALTGAGLLLYGRSIVRRLNGLQRRIIAVGRGEWGESLAVDGTDEIASLGEAFNQMRTDLLSLDAGQKQSSETILALNGDLNRQLQKVEQLKEQLAEENAGLRKQLRRSAKQGAFVGQSAPMQALLNQTNQVAPMPINILITGESGTGKELLASLIHEHSERVRQPFVKINCAALPENLIESELFGHEKGAFTGAVNQYKGKFEQAHGGTLFMDEVGELPPDAQAKLLRALHQGEIQRLGGSGTIAVDVRIVAATNRDLEREAKAGRFREDLYYRLKVIELQTPPLREILDDLPQLAQHFVERQSAKLGRSVVGISPSALRKLSAYGWPGNVRELEHAISRAVALAGTQVLGPEDFEFLAVVDTLAVAPAGEDALQRVLDTYGLPASTLEGGDAWSRLTAAGERVLIAAAMARTHTQKEAADMLGINPTKMHRLLKKHGL